MVYVPTYGFGMLNEDLAQRAENDIIYLFTLEFVAISGVTIIPPTNSESRRKKYHMIQSSYMIPIIIISKWCKKLRRLIQLRQKPRHWFAVRR